MLPVRAALRGYYEGGRPAVCAYLDVAQGRVPAPGSLCD